MPERDHRLWTCHREGEAGPGWIEVWTDDLESTSYPYPRGSSTPDYDVALRHALERGAEAVLWAGRDKGCVLWQVVWSPTRGGKSGRVSSS